MTIESFSAFCIKLLCAFMFLAACAKHTNVGEILPPTYAADRTYVFYTNSPGDWTIVSKSGPEKAVKEICPHGAICTTEVVGTMYRVRRVH